eukprot:1157217-Pelagomonas_calceolata.AAC.4
MASNTVKLWFCSHQQSTTTRLSAHRWLPGGCASIIHKLHYHQQSTNSTVKQLVTVASTCFKNPQASSSSTIHQQHGQAAS